MVERAEARVPKPNQDTAGICLQWLMVMINKTKFGAVGGAESGHPLGLAKTQEADP